MLPPRNRPTGSKGGSRQPVVPRVVSDRLSGFPMALIYATWDDVVETYEGTIPETQRLRVESLIRRASARLTAMVPSLPARMAAGTIDPEIPLGLVVEAVCRFVRNPQGLSAQQAGPFTMNFSGGVNGQRADVWYDYDQVHELCDPVADSVAGTFRVAVPHHHWAADGLDVLHRPTYIPERFRRF
jgi:hypothetical protein